jgi:hypothetical protein
MTLLPHTEPGDWICEACNGPLVSLGVLGRTEHARCRLCGLDHNRPVAVDEGSDEPDLDQEALNPLFQSPILTRPGESLIDTIQEARDEDFNNDMKPRP